MSKKKSPSFAKVLLAVIGVGIILGVVFSGGDDDSKPESEPKPTYMGPELNYIIAEYDDISYAGCKRDAYWVVFPPDSSQEDIDQFVEGKLITNLHANSPPLEVPDDRTESARQQLLEASSSWPLETTVFAYDDEDDVGKKGATRGVFEKGSCE